MPRDDAPRTFEWQNSQLPPFNTTDAQFPPWQRVPPKRRSRLDYYLRLLVGVGAVSLGWSLISGTWSGSSPKSHHEYVDIPIVKPAGAAGAMPLDSAEKFVFAYRAHTDANGSYVESGLVLTRAFGAELVWSDWDSPDPSSPCRHDQDTPKPVAWFCSAEPYLVHLNRTDESMPRLLYSAWFIDTVRHELAHLIINQRCGTATPAPGTVELEGVTSSYAVLYLGADPEGLADATSASSAYLMTPETDDTASRIHEGMCW